MINIITKISKEKYWDYFILCARFLLAWTFLRYGYSKLIDGQFGVTEAELLLPVKDISLFKLSWYLFNHEPFKTAIGVAQVLCGILLLINRTVIIGAILFLPIVFNILIIDLSFMNSFMASSFAYRLSFYILLDWLILWHYKDKMKLVWTAIWQNTNTKFRFKLWHYLILPVMAILLEIIGILPKALFTIIRNPKMALRELE